MRTKGHITYRTDDGEIVPGVTTVTALRSKPALVRWANKLGLEGVDSSRYAADTAEIGVLAHSMIIDSLTGTESCTMDYSENQISLSKSCLLRFQAWARGHTVEPILTETPLVSEKYRYGGTCDLFALVDGTKEVVDIKTSSDIWPEHKVQIAGYMQLLTEAGHTVERARILCIPRSGDGWQEVVLTGDSLALYFEIFQCLLKVHQVEKQTQN